MTKALPVALGALMLLVGLLAKAVGADPAKTKSPPTRPGNGA